MNEFEAGTKARLGILPKDAFGNNVTSTSEDLNFHNFTLSALYPNNGSIASLLNITQIGWNGLGYISIDFVAVKAGNFFLLVQGRNQTLTGNPLAFKVNPGDVFYLAEKLVSIHLYVSVLFIYIDEHRCIFSINHKFTYHFQDVQTITLESKTVLHGKILNCLKVG